MHRANYSEEHTHNAQTQKEKCENARKNGEIWKKRNDERVEVTC